MDKLFSLFGKIVLVLVIIIVLAGGGYYFGNKYAKKSSPSPTTTPQVTQSAASQTVTTAPTEAQQQSQATRRFAVTAGGLKPFSAFTLSGIGGWTKTEEKSTNIDKLILTKGQYEIVILQGPAGTASCTFPGQTPQEMSIQLTTSTDIPLLNGTPLKRGKTQSPTPDSADFAVCQQSQQGGYSTFTDFGIINYYTPLNPDSQTLAEMDAMTGSLQKQ